MSIADRLHELGLELPEPFAPAGNYVPATITGNLLFTAGQVPRAGDDFAYRGRVGADLTLEDGYEAARLCCLGGLAVALRQLDTLDRIVQVVKVNGFVRSTPDFNAQPKVINGASDLLVELFGERGKHARTAVGVHDLPLGVGVEVDFLFEFD
jgi:enamine deaminase RidA (YjgF/YER057c/UK114 family)